VRDLAENREDAKPAEDAEKRYFWVQNQKKLCDLGGLCVSAVLTTDALTRSVR